MAEEPRARQPDEMFCDHCGSVIKKDVQFCPNCGESVASVSLVSPRAASTAGARPASQFAACPHCGGPGQQGPFCRICGLYMPEETGAMERVTYTRRFFGTWLLEGVLFFLTLIVGWYIWLAFTAGKSQSPAKSLLGVYVIDVDTGGPVSAGRIWVREVLIKQLLMAFVNFITGVAGLVDALWVFFDKNRQTLHDKVASTYVVYAPAGLPAHLTLRPGLRDGAASGKRGVEGIAEQLRVLASLHKEGILTDEEYQRKRDELAGKL
jgi:uncharacterized RDD family membrane protein YckC